MLRVTEISQTSEEAVLRVEGWVAGAGVGLLEKEGVRHLQPNQRLVLDLKGVKFIDQAGLDLLQGWKDKGVVLRNGSVFIQVLLETHRLV